ncbi:MAG: DUF1667 domain-containing protein [Oscillospiraceae bacterium]|jgi:CxxC motif-containing protein|nr:DUF1667 domain-containing protein [Oscillospiraceae bacterium]
MTKMLCIVCPVGCRLTAVQEGGAVTVTGNLCQKGEAFGAAELQNPMRTLQTTVRTVFPDAPALPVRSAGEIPKGLIPAALRELADIVVDTRTGCGGVILDNLAGTGISVIATSDILREAE